MTLERAGSAPPSPPPPPPSPPAPPARQPLRSNTGPHAALSEDTAARALRISLANREAIGEAPNPLVGYEGTGLWKMLGGIRGDLTRVLAWVDTESAARGGRVGWASRVGWIVVQTLTTAGVLAALAWAAGLHR